jgi:hypothetical protein
VVSGLISQQMANQPGASYAQGVFSQLTDRAVDMYLGYYRSGAADQSNEEASHAGP